MNEKQLQALVRKNIAKSVKAQKGQRWQDPTLSVSEAEEREAADAKDMFKEMKRREF